MSLLNIFLLFTFQLFSLFALAQSKNEQNKSIIFPVPEVKHLLFYIQRNANTNTIVYEANMTSEGKLNPKNPVDVYWIRYADKGQRKELNYIENALAYGINVKPQKEGSSTFILTFAASKAYKIMVYVDKEGHPKAQILIHHKPAKLEKIFVQAHETSWLPKVSYVELFGTDLHTGEKVSQKILP